MPEGWVRVYTDRVEHVLLRRRAAALHVRPTTRSASEHNECRRIGVTNVAACSSLGVSGALWRTGRDSVPLRSRRRAAHRYFVKPWATSSTSLRDDEYAEVCDVETPKAACGRRRTLGWVDEYRAVINLDYT